MHLRALRCGFPRCLKEVPDKDEVLPGTSSEAVVGGKGGEGSRRIPPGSSGERAADLGGRRCLPPLPGDFDVEAADQKDMKIKWISLKRRMCTQKETIGTNLS